MSLPLVSVMREVEVETILAAMDRTKHDEPTQFLTIKDGMLYIHSAFQDLMKAVRAQKDLPDTAIMPAVRVAAASAKFVADLGVAANLELLHKDAEHRRAILKDQVKRHGKPLAMYLGLKY